jgi:hypothetical protein
MKRVFRKLNQAIDDGLLNEVFNHVRNFLYAAMFLAAGSYTARHQENEILFGLVLAREDYGFESVGIAIVTIGIVLLLLNLYSGIYKLSKRKHPFVWSIFLTLIYVIASIRIVEVMWNFRDRM